MAELDTSMPPLVKGHKTPTAATKIVIEALRGFVMAHLDEADREKVATAEAFEATIDGMLIRVRTVEPFWIVCEAAGGGNAS